MEQSDHELWAVAAEYYKLKSEGKNPIVQYLDRNNTWNDYNDCYSFDIPNFNDGDIWRLKPETIQHRGGEYPKPCTDVDEITKAQTLYKPSWYIEDNELKPSCIELPKAHNFSKYLENGMAKSGSYYLNREDAIERAKVIYEID